MSFSLGKIKVLLSFLFLLLTLNFLTAQTLRHPANEPNEQGQDVRPTGHVLDAPVETMAAQPAPRAVVQGNGINYHGGPVLHGNVPIYVIWYGNWTNGPKASDSQTTVNLIDAFLGGLSGSALELINTTYGDNTANVSGQLHLQSQIFDTGSQGTSLTNTRLTNLISSHLNNGSLPTDPTGVYLVLTSSNISERGFCTQFCGFHTAQTIHGADIKWAFVGNVDKCPSGCEAQTTSPNGDSGADGMANTLSHEIEEAISDPDLNAWFDANGQENGDKCNFNFGAVSTASNGSAFNQTFGGHNWLLQQNWRNSLGGACAQHL
ncbi:MAG TPA: hypothetical protein VG759_29840 [Candidatus Angelobacter sp.]|jgi:hypothetical protein|nr:hypothetical protein [Candidatus Angelobacter sp.]